MTMTLSNRPKGATDLARNARTQAAVQATPTRAEKGQAYEDAIARSEQSYDDYCASPAGQAAIASLAAGRTADADAVARDAAMDAFLASAGGHCAICDGPVGPLLLVCDACRAEQDRINAPAPAPVNHHLATLTAVIADLEGEVTDDLRHFAHDLRNVIRDLTTHAEAAEVGMLTGMDVLGSQVQRLEVTRARIMAKGEQFRTLKYIVERGNELDAAVGA